MRYKYGNFSHASHTQSNIIKGDPAKSWTAPKTTWPYRATGAMISGLVIIYLLILPWTVTCILTHLCIYFFNIFFSRTPLHLCAGCLQSLEVSFVLVEHGARIEDNDIEGVRPVDLHLVGCSTYMEQPWELGSALGNCRRKCQCNRQLRQQIITNAFYQTQLCLVRDITKISLLFASLFVLFLTFLNNCRCNVKMCWQFIAEAFQSQFPGLWNLSKNSYHFLNNYMRTLSKLFWSFRQ